jgi:hypothetical protein
MLLLLEICVTILSAVVGGVLGALGGASNSSKVYRRVVLPILLFSYVAIKLWSLWPMFVLTLMGWFSLGYGVPDATDEGSYLGRLAYKLTKQSYFWSDVLVRGFIGILVSLSLIAIPTILKNWIAYSVLSLVIIVGYSFLSWRNLGRYRLFGKELLWSETIVYSTISAAVVTLTYWRM